MAAYGVRVYGQAWPARIKLTRLTTNSNRIVETTITDKDIIAQCASKNDLDAKRLKLFQIGDDLVVVDILASNRICTVATLAGGGSLSNSVQLRVFRGKMQGAGCGSLNSSGEGILPRDFSGTFFVTWTEALPSTVVSLKGTIQDASVTNSAVYTGTLSVAGKPFFLQPP